MIRNGRKWRIKSADEVSSFINEDSKDGRLKIAIKVGIHFPFRIINTEYSEVYNKFLDMFEKYIESNGYIIKYG